MNRELRPRSLQGRPPDNGCLLFSGTVRLIGLPTKNWGVRPAFLYPRFHSFLCADSKHSSSIPSSYGLLLRKVLLLLGDEVYENWRPLCGSFWARPCWQGLPPRG